MSRVSDAEAHTLDMLHHRQEPVVILVLPLHIFSPTSTPGSLPTAQHYQVFLGQTSRDL